MILFSFYYAVEDHKDTSGNSVDYRRIQPCGTVLLDWTVDFPDDRTGMVREDLLGRRHDSLIVFCEKLCK